MRSLYATLAVIVLLATLSGCASQTPPKAQSQSDSNTDLAAYSTFGWRPVPGLDAGNEPLRLLDVNIRKAIRAELTRRPDPEFRPCSSPA